MNDRAKEIICRHVWLKRCGRIFRHTRKTGRTIPNIWTWGENFPNNFFLWKSGHILPEEQLPLFPVGQSLWLTLSLIQKITEIVIKGSIQEENITIINMYAPNTGALQYVRQMLRSVKGEINSNTIIVGDFNTPLTPMDRATKQKINKEIQTSNDTIDQLDLIDIYRTFHPKTMNFTFFSSAYGTFSRIDHILGHKFSLGKFRKIEIIPSIFSDHNAVRLDVSYREKKLLKIQTYGG